jgi:hypothetical protein
MTILHDHNLGGGNFETAKKNNHTVPGWKKSDHFLKTHPNVKIETGADGTGNILSVENFIMCREKYGSSMNLITADGGFDFSVDFNNQEVNIYQLLFGQVCYALCLQKHGGDFILKIFDCFMEHTLDILYILSAFYENVYITNPKTSRYENSEKYILFKKFVLLNDSAIFPYLRSAFEKMLSFPETEIMDKPMCEVKIIHRFLKIPIPSYFIYKIEEYNAIFGQQQIENIYQTIVLIEQFASSQQCKYQHKMEEIEYVDEINDLDTIPRKEDRCSEKNISDTQNPPSEKFEKIVRDNLRKCIQWCIHHNISYNVIDEYVSEKKNKWEKI